MTNALANISSIDYVTNSDFNLVNHLLSKPRYNIPERLRDKIILSCEKVLDSETTDDKTKFKAMNVLLKADERNIDLVKLCIPKKIEHFNVKGATDEDLQNAIIETMKLLPNDSFQR